MIERCLRPVWRSLRHYDRGLLLAGAILLAVLAIASYAAFGYLRYERIAVAEKLAAGRAERANADLQDALARMGDQLTAEQARLDALNEQLAAAQARMKAADELERQLAAYEEAMARRPVRGRRGARRGRPAILALVRSAPAVPQPPSPPIDTTAVAAASGDLKNFTAPGWVPSYFASESAPFLGSSGQ